MRRSGTQVERSSVCQKAQRHVAICMAAETEADATKVFFFNVTGAARGRGCSMQVSPKPDLTNLNVGAIICSYDQAAIHLELHVGCSGSLCASSADVLRQLGCRDDDFCQGDIVVRHEHNLHQGVSVSVDSACILMCRWTQSSTQLVLLYFCRNRYTVLMPKWPSQVSSHIDYGFPGVLPLASADNSIDSSAAFGKILANGF